MFRVWRDLFERHTPPEHLVFFCCWNDDLAGTAEVIWRLAGSNGKPPKVGIYAYSWGATSAMKLARHLGDRGIGVTAMVLSDPVYRWRWALWRVLFRWPKITVPANVAEVHWFRQRTSWPFGHDLVAEDANKTKIHQPEWCLRKHTFMDDAEPFQMLVRITAKQIAGGNR